MEYLRIYAGLDGESRFEEMPVEFEAVDFAPPAPPIDLSAFNSVARYAFCRFRAGWYGDWHPTPRRQVFFLLSGEMEVEVGEGEVRRIGPGSVVLVEDTTGTGHVSRVTSATDVLAAVVQLPD